ncbi:MAG: branched-chain amino acid transport system II carrier protein [Candidatus Babeliales bacterium]
MFKKFFSSEIITTGLAIFSMFFGAANLMFPLKVGLSSGTHLAWGIAGFLLTGVLIPFAGLIAIILFQGDYTQFFYRLGRIPGFLFIAFCLIAAGPLIAMPRIVTFSYTVLTPFFPTLSLFAFCLIFLALTFWATYKESKIVDFLGNIISPVLLLGLAIIIVKGYFTSAQPIVVTNTAAKVFWDNIIAGYQTLDILAGILFSAIVITILQKNYSSPGKPSFKHLAMLSFQAGLVGVGLLALVYIGLAYLGAYHGHGLESINEGELFSAVSQRILGQHGALIIATTVLMACYSTIIALTAVFSEFLNTQIFNGKLGYIPAVLITLGLTLITSLFGLSSILAFSKPIIIITYPALITLTFFNIAYKIFNVKPIKIPVAITLIISSISYFWY